MSDTNQPGNPTNSRFGWPKPARVEEFNKLNQKPTGATERLVFQGKMVDLPIIRVPIDLPKYRMANGRTASLQAEYQAKNESVRDNLFSGDPELWDAQAVQHALLLDLAKVADLGKYFADPTKTQVDPILLDENGFVVNGNRRLATWRELLHNDNKKYAHFGHIDVAVLPHCDEKEIDKLEATLQIQKDIRADYNWDALANMMVAKQKRDHFSNKEIGDLYSMKEAAVEELLDMRTYAEEYLNSRDKANHWSLVSGDEFAFRKIVSLRSKVGGVGKQEIFKQAAFILIDKPEDAGGRLYEMIPAIVESIDEVKSKLLEDFEVKAPEATAGIDALFGGSAAAPVADALDMPLAKEIQRPENAERARKIIVEVIESQKQLRKDAKSAGYLLDCCSKAQAQLAAAVKEGLRPESTKKGVTQQLDQIQSHIDSIRAFIAANAKN